MSITDSAWAPAADRDTLVRRARLFTQVRRFMAARGVLEVDAPQLSRAAPSERGLECLAVPGAGYLVPSPEHGLKRLLAAGCGPVYQLGHVWRAGESGRWHNPEFCMLEWYRPGATMDDAISETAALLAEIAKLSPPRRVTYRALFVEHTGLDPLEADVSDLADFAARCCVAPSEAGVAGDQRTFWLDLLMSLVVQPRLASDGLVCVTHFPSEDAVLVAEDRADARYSQRFEFYWHGIELANGARELTDTSAAEQRMRREQDARRANGQRAVAPDPALLAAMRAGLPECAGVALGIDRLLALLLDRADVAGVMPFAWAHA